MNSIFVKYFGDAFMAFVC